MLAALRDPFHESLASGISQGPLVVKSRGRGIPTYSTPMAARRSASLSDRAILGEIQQGVGGSFSNFLSNVFGSTQGKEGGVPGEVAEENPFSKPADAAAPDQAANNSAAPEPKPEIKAAAKSAPDPAPAQPQAEPAPAAPGRLATAVRPDILLHVGEAGQLQSVPAVVLNENTIETAELGMQKVNMLTFANPTEIPVAIAVADFNSDSIPDIGFVDGRAGLLRLLYGDSEGAYVEAMRVEVGGGARSLVSGDFNGDGRTDLAISNVGIGAITVLYFGDSEDSHSFTSFWVDSYRDYLAAASTAPRGISELIGMNFGNSAQVLDSGMGSGAGKRFETSPALDCIISTFNARKVQVNAVMLGSNLSLNLQNLQNQLANVLNVQAGNDVYICIGDISYDNTISVAIATLKK